MLVPVPSSAAAPHPTLRLPASTAPAQPLRGLVPSPLAARPISRRAAGYASSVFLAPPRAVPPEGASSPLLSVPVPDEPDADADTDDTPMDKGDGKQVGLATSPAPVPPPPERDFAGTPYVPVYVMLPLNVVSVEGEVVDADALVAQLRLLRAAGVDGVMVDCWWGNVEAHGPQEYNWTGYRRLFHIVRELKLKLQVPSHIVRRLFHIVSGEPHTETCNKNTKPQTDWQTILSIVVAAIVVIISTYTVGNDSKCIQRRLLSRYDPTRGLSGQL